MSDLMTSILDATNRVHQEFQVRRSLLHAKPHTQLHTASHSFRQLHHCHAHAHAHAHVLPYALRPSPNTFP